MGRRHALGHAHAPRIEDEFFHLSLVNGGQPHAEPVVAHIGLARQQEFSRLGRDDRNPLVLRKAESHDLLVRGEGQENDAANPELNPVPDKRLVRARQPGREGPDVVDGYHVSQPASCH